jgi:hypothetical protein
VHLGSPTDCSLINSIALSERHKTHANLPEIGAGIRNINLYCVANKRSDGRIHYYAYTFANHIHVIYLVDCLGGKSSFKILAGGLENGRYISVFHQSTKSGLSRFVGLRTEDSVPEPENGSAEGTAFVSEYQSGSRTPRPSDALAFWRRYSA